MNVVWYMSDLHACGHVRGETLARVVNSTRPNDFMVCKNAMLASDFPKANIMVFQRQHTGTSLDKMAAAQNMGIKCIYELDDDLFNTPEQFIEPFKFYDKPEVRGTIISFLKNADAITVSTYELAKQLRQHTEKPIFVIENALDCEMWESAFYAKKPNDDVTIGWMASGSHTIDAPLVLEPLHRIMLENTNVKLHLIGWVGWQQLGDMFADVKDRIKTEPWVDIYDLPMAMKDFDINLAPLVDNLFNRSKSNIKWLQGASLGAPTIASKLHPYYAISDGIDGLLVEDDGWYNAIRSLVTDEAKRKQIAETARKRLYKQYDIRHNASNWLNVFSMILEGK